MFQLNYEVVDFDDIQEFMDNPPASLKRVQRSFNAVANDVQHLLNRLDSLESSNRCQHNLRLLRRGDCCSLSRWHHDCAATRRTLRFWCKGNEETCEKVSLHNRPDDSQSG